MSNMDSEKFDLLRKQTEELLQNQPDLASRMPADILDLIDELKVRNAELEIQNKGLQLAQKEISRLHQEYENLYEFAPCGYMTLDDEGVVSRVNLTGVRLLGNSKAHIMKSPLGRFLDPEWEDAYQEARKRCEETGEKQSVELGFKSENGSPLWVMAEIEAQQDKSGKTILWQMAFVDITGQKIADATLRESEQRFSAIFENMSSGVAVYRPIDGGKDFVFMGFNPAAERISRITKEKVLGNRLMAIFPNMVRSSLPGALKRVWETGIEEYLPPFYYEDENRKGWRENRIYKLPTGEVVALFDDVTARVSAEEALRESEEEHRLLVEHQTDLLVKIDADGIFHFVSPSYCKMFGRTEDELLGQHLMTFVHPDDREITAEEMERAYRPPHTAYLEHRAMTRDGWKWFAWLNTGVLNENGDVTGLIGLGRDITERKEAEIEKERLQSQLGQVRKMEAIGNLAGGIAHEFNNVLGLILGNAELAMDDVPDWHPAKESLKEIHTACLRVKEVVRQILNFARKTTTDLKPLELNTMVKGSLKLMRASIPTMIDIQQSIPSEPHMILGDPTEIHQIIVNVCTNAARAMKKSGGVLQVGISEVSLSVKRAAIYEDIAPGDFVILTIKDSGEGIEPDIQEKVAEPHFATQEFGAASGMGLSVVYGIVKKCKGAIRINSEVGEGTTVEILFPKIDAEDPSTLMPEEELPTGNERILLVDDEASIVRMIRHMLERLGYRVLPMTDSVEALKRFRASPDEFDFVITDMAMPNMSGDQLAAQLIKIRKDVPILLCTGYSELVDEEKVKEMGIKGFALKPLDKGKLARAVRAILDGR